MRPMAKTLCNISRAHEPLRLERSGWGVGFSELCEAVAQKPTFESYNCVILEFISARSS